MSTSETTPAGGVRVCHLRLINAFLVPEDDGLTLIDTTLKGGAKRILAAAEGLGRPITRILLTHAHDDHVGGLDTLAERLPGVEVVISARDARLLQGDRTLDPDEPQSKLRGGLPSPSTAPTRTIEAGEQVGALRAVAAPGHTPGQLAFLDERDGTLYCGDAYSTVRGVSTSAKVKAVFPFPTLATWHRPTALTTAEELRALGPQRLAPGHGPIVIDPGAGMDRAIARGC